MRKLYTDATHLRKISSALRERENERVDYNTFIMNRTMVIYIYSVTEPPVAIIHSCQRDTTSPFETYDVIGNEDDIRILEKEVGIESKLKQE